MPWGKKIFSEIDRPAEISYCTERNSHFPFFRVAWSDGEQGGGVEDTSKSKSRCVPGGKLTVNTHLIIYNSILIIHEKYKNTWYKVMSSSTKITRSMIGFSMIPGPCPSVYMVPEALGVQLVCYVMDTRFREKFLVTQGTMGN